MFKQVNNKIEMCNTIAKKGLEIISPVCVLKVIADSDSTALNHFW